jgi:anthranilate phosphoribosyltransferase
VPQRKPGPFYKRRAFRYSLRVLEGLTSQLLDREALSDQQVQKAVIALTAEADTPEAKAEFLTALARKGETVEEIAAFATELRDKAVPVPLDIATRNKELLDVCGTGGDKLNTFNISTTVAFVVAAAGVTVAKHGNRAITSKTGSADLLEALGIRIDLKPDAAARWLHEHGFAFFFAPNYHPAFKHIGPARKLCAERGQRTIFNFLGPLLNPARPTAQLIGVPRPELCEPIARVLQLLGVRRGMVVSGCVGTADNCFLDELSTLGPTTVAEFYQERGFASSTLSHTDFALQPAKLADLAGTDRESNAALVMAILEGKDKGPRRDAVLLNAAAALLVAGKVKSLSEGWDMAAQTLDAGKAAAKLRELQKASKA